MTKKQTKPIYMCVTPDDGTWNNAYQDVEVTPPTPDLAPRRPLCTLNSSFDPSFILQQEREREWREHNPHRTMPEDISTHKKY